MGVDIDFFRINREQFKRKFIELEDSKEFILFTEYIDQQNIVEQRTYSKADAAIIVQKIKEDSLLLNR